MICSLTLYIAAAIYLVLGFLVPDAGRPSTDTVIWQIGFIICAHVFIVGGWILESMGK